MEGAADPRPSFESATVAGDGVGKGDMGHLLRGLGGEVCKMGLGLK